MVAELLLYNLVNAVSSKHCLTTFLIVKRPSYCSCRSISAPQYRHFHSFFSLIYCNLPAHCVHFLATKLTPIPDALQSFVCYLLRKSQFLITLHIEQLKFLAHLKCIRNLIVIDRNSQLGNLAAAVDIGSEYLTVSASLFSACLSSGSVQEDDNISTSTKIDLRLVTFCFTFSPIA